MKRFVAFTVAIGGLLTLVALFVSSGTSMATPLPRAASGEGKAPDGKAIFLAQKCNLCHAVEVVGIEATTKSEKLKGPDLTGLAEKREGAWLVQYLKKEVGLEGKKHSKEFKGTDEELQALIGWLKGQKKEEERK